MAVRPCATADNGVTVVVACEEAAVAKELEHELDGCNHLGRTVRDS